MDLTFSEEQHLIRETARDFLDRECPASLVRAMEAEDRGHPEALWAGMAGLGWLGAAFPEHHGGAGYSFLDLCLLIEEQGRHRAPGPFLPTVVLCGLAIARFGSEAQQADYLGAIAAGERILTYAETEPGGSWGPTRIDLAATAEGDGYRLDGTKTLVPYAHVADELLVAARTRDAGEVGVTLFLVEAGAPGIEREPLETLGGDRQHEVRFHGVRVPAGRVLGPVDGGWPVVQAVNAWGAAATCAEMVGGAQRVLEMSVDYAGQRTQFGRPIGSFQAVQHACADMLSDVETARLIAYEAIWRLSEDVGAAEAAEAVSMAKAWVSDAYQRVCALGHQIHGAVGYTAEHDLQLYFRHARAAELAFGDADHHRERLARLLRL